MDLTKSSKKTRLATMLYCIAVFLCMFVFFFCFHPPVILDADDWQYISYVRPAVPYTGFWNPSRILPEILMPFCGTVALAVSRIAGAGYIESQCLVFSIVLSVFITVYIYTFVRMTEQKFSLSRSFAMLLGAVFLSLHFLIFRTEDSDNLYMFSSYDTCCYFYYTIPALLNCSLVMYFSYSDMLSTFFSGENLLWKAFLAVILYLAVFSNLFNSIILVAYLGCDFLMDLVYMVRQKLRLRDLLKADLFQLLIILMWLAAVFFESRGGRGSGYWPKKEYLSNLRETFGMFPGIARSFSLMFILVAAVSIIGAIIAYFISHAKTEPVSSGKTDSAYDGNPEEEQKEAPFPVSFANSSDSVNNSDRFLFEFFDLHFSAAAVMILFLSLLCARVEKTYFTRPQVMFGFIYSLFVIIVSCMAYILGKYKKAVLLIPAMLLVIFSVINTQGTTFAPSNTLSLNERVCINVDNDLIEQMKKADTDGTERLALQVMNTGIDNNWPHTAHVAYGLKQTLLKHGIITRNFEIVPEMSTEFNERNGIEVEVFWPDMFRSFYPTLY